MNSHERLTQRLAQALQEQQTADGPWEGRLSSSALSTALAAFALHRLAPDQYRDPVNRALDWLCRNIHADGSWGDTCQSRGNLSTTLLGWAALKAVAGERESYAPTLNAAAFWIASRTGDLSPASIASAVLARYGRDRTFSVPILAMLAMAGCLGPDETAWRQVPQMPFELAAIPSRCYRWVRLPMVSYALPALIAIGLVRHRRRRTGNSAIGWLRDRWTPNALDVLTRIQPSHGGFLDAAPLTAFVAMALCAAGETHHPVAKRAGAFLLKTVRDDGSWPIDTNLKTWVTTLAVQALSDLSRTRFAQSGATARFPAIRDWLLRTQTRGTHPYTGAAPGGWAWTDLPGGVPDADDTAGALIALRRLADGSESLTPAERDAAERGVCWLLDLQNRDGGIPTFCRGWGNLPFDRSCPDLTAHMLLAMQVWLDQMPGKPRKRMRRAMGRAIRHLEHGRNRDGSWSPLWFGNENAPDQENRTYGTAKVLLALRRLDMPAYAPRLRAMIADGRRWLLENRNRDGGWGAGRGTPSSMEETALATHALAVLPDPPGSVLESAIAWMDSKVPPSGLVEPAPIGLYFARLWYAERLYPLIYALNACAACCDA